mgnify:CR=1 FL=1
MDTHRSRAGRTGSAISCGCSTTVYGASRRAASRRPWRPRRRGIVYSSTTDAISLSIFSVLFPVKSSGMAVYLASRMHEHLLCSLYEDLPVPTIPDPPRVGKNKACLIKQRPVTSSDSSTVDINRSSCVSNVPIVERNSLRREARGLSVRNAGVGWNWRTLEPR